MRRRWLLSTLSLLLTATSACHHQSAADSSGSPPTTQPLATIIVHRDRIFPHAQLAGIIAPFQNVAIQSTLTEPADQVVVEEGDTVHQGQLLAQLDTADLVANLHADLATVQSNRALTTHTVYQGRLSIAQGVDTLQSAKTAVLQARANLRRDQADLTRYTTLFRNGYVTQQQVVLTATTVNVDEQALQAAITAVASAQSNVQANGGLQTTGLQSSAIAQAQATIAQAQAEAEQIRVQISKATILSPIDGIVVNRNLNPGEYPGTRQIFTLQQVNPIFAILHGTGAEIAEMTTGSQATITLTDLRNTQISGQVVGILNQLTPGSTDFEVKVQLNNLGHRIRPGMAIEGTIALPAITGIKIPLTAFATVGHDTVWSVAADGSIHATKIVDLGEDAKSAIVKGLPAQSRLITNGQIQVAAGQKGSTR